MFQKVLQFLFKTKRRYVHQKNKKTINVRVPNTYTNTNVNQQMYKSTSQKRECKIIK